MVLIKQLLDCIWMAGTVDLGATYLALWACKAYFDEQKSNE